MSETYTSPANIEASTADVNPLKNDATALLAQGETVTGIATSLTKLSDGTTVTLTDAPTFTTTSATQTIRGSALTAGQRYRLVWAFTLSSGAVLGQATIITVDY